MAALNCLSVVLLLFIMNSCGYLAAPVSFAPTNGLLPNGNFEEGPDPSNMNKKKIIKGKYSLPKWVKKGLIRYISPGPQPGHRTFKVHAVRLGQNSSVSQYLWVKRETYYSVSFSVSKSCFADKFIRVGISKNQVESDYLLHNIYESEKPETYGWTFKSSNNSTLIKLSFFSPPNHQRHSLCGPLLLAVALKEIKPLSQPTDNNLVKNGDFENGPYVMKNFSSGVLLPPDSLTIVSPLPGWTIKSKDPIKTVKYIDSQHFKVPKGRYGIELLGEQESTLSQLIPTIPNQFYNLTFITGDARNGCIGNLYVKASAGNQSVVVEHVSQGKGKTKFGNLRFQAVNQTTTISFMSLLSHSSDFGITSCGPILDDVKVVPNAL